MRAIVFICVVLIGISGFYPIAEASPDNPVKAAFIRGGNLWMKEGELEKQLTKDGGASHPRWSHDGLWIAYMKATGQQSHEVWVYNSDTDRHVQAYGSSGTNLQWSPTTNILAFQDESVLNITDTGHMTENSFENVALGVNNYSWLPDGSGFLASSTAARLPDGWTHPMLYKIPVDAKMDDKKIKHFFTIPSELTKGDVMVLSIGTTIFKWSYDRKWIAFVVHPTASWSADSDMLCLLSSNGKKFIPLDEMLANSSWFQWAPVKTRLAYIQGGGRMALENKHLKVKELPALRSPTLTPEGYADGNFVWLNDDTITVSRTTESKWSSDTAERPLPVLVRLTLQSPVQHPITTPPAGFGDYAPAYLKASNKLGWIRSDRSKAYVMLGQTDGSGASTWISSLDTGSNYYEQWDWGEVLSWYEAG
ncbi:translocation protein TolB [Paenibacillus sp. RC67]|uniref:TolB family protein n=1 Tax=Paenibacillus sp. RC67 TaxID=3039392 RepID=UPI0024AE5DC3|nr:translocation protein TolB [Paenibacillus sp. RC67]